MRRALPKAMTVLMLALASPTGAAQQVNVATSARGLIELPIVVAMRNRYFAAEGLEIQKIQITPDVAVKALVGGEVDFNLDWDAPVRAAISGVPVKLVAATAGRPLRVLIARPEVRSGTNLRGKSLGVDALDSTTDYLARVAVRYLGLDPDKDVAIVEIGGSAASLHELRAGNIHAAIVDSMAAARAEEEGFHTLVRIADVIDLPALGIAVTEKKLAGEREQVKRFIRSTLRGARFIKQNRGDTLRIIQSYLKTTSPQAARAYDAAVGAFTDDGLIAQRALALSVRRAREGLSIADEPKLNKVADWSVLQEILADRRKVPFWLKQYDP